MARLGNNFILLIFLNIIVFWRNNICLTVRTHTAKEQKFFGNGGGVAACFRNEPVKKLEEFNQNLIIFLQGLVHHIFDYQYRQDGF